ncbi:MAG: hypothetical protein QOH56_1652 [Pseudonocardiales bacterium]|nr:hypothetical protein [Pseudonocardiales bacterium]
MISADPGQARGTTAVRNYYDLNRAYVLDVLDRPGVPSYLPRHQVSVGFRARAASSRTDG